MNTNTQKAVYNWFAKRDFVCSFEDFVEKFEFADSSITFSGFVVYKKAGKKDGEFEGLNFHDLTKTSTNGNRPPIRPKETNFVGLDVDGIENVVTVTITF